MDTETVQAVGMGGALVVCGLWIVVYFWKIMPTVKRRLGERLGVTVVENADTNLLTDNATSSWEADETTSLRKSLTIWLVEMGSYLFLLVLPIAIIIIPAFIILDNLA